MKKLFSLVIIAIILVCTGNVWAAENGTNPSHYSTSNNVVTNSIAQQEPDNGLDIQNTTQFLEYWNEKMNWGLSRNQIDMYSIKMREQILSNLTTKDNQWFHIQNVTKFNEDVGSIIGLTDQQITAFIAEDRKQLIIDRQNYDKAYQAPEKTASLTRSASSQLTSVAPSSQSAPDAVGKLYYLYIFTDFSIPSGYGSWTQADINAEPNKADAGTLQIHDQAPTNANVVNQRSWVQVSVDEQNLGTSGEAATWGADGWMENAAQQAGQQLGYGSNSQYDRYSEYLARSLKTTYDADSVMLVFVTHDEKGATATGPDSGYADKVLISFKGLRPDESTWDSEAGSYEHEILHAYGALDEYGGGNGIECNGGPSGLAVSPMYETYLNTNYETCPSATLRGVMYKPYSSVITPFWYEINTSTRNFIGRGDYDNDGILDSLDPDPYNTTYFTLTPTSGSGGTITPASPVTVQAGGSQTFIISPATGYSIADVAVDGASQGAISRYTFTNV
jgi:hypothetical protein